MKTKKSNHSPDGAITCKEQTGSISVAKQKIPLKSDRASNQTRQPNSLKSTTVETRKGSEICKCGHTKYWHGAGHCVKGFEYDDTGIMINKSCCCERFIPQTPQLKEKSSNRSSEATTARLTQIQTRRNSSEEVRPTAISHRSSYGNLSSEIAETRKGYISERRKSFIISQNKIERDYLNNNIMYMEHFCVRCRKKILRGVDWAELSKKDGKYYWNGTPTEEESQGWFPFGLDCIKYCVDFNIQDKKGSEICKNCGHKKKHHDYYEKRDDDIGICLNGCECQKFIPQTPDALAEDKLDNNSKVAALGQSDETRRIATSALKNLPSGVQTQTEIQWLNRMKELLDIEFKEADKHKGQIAQQSKLMLWMFRTQIVKRLRELDTPQTKPNTDDSGKLKHQANLLSEESYTGDAQFAECKLNFEDEILKEIDTPDFHKILYLVYYKDLAKVIQLTRQKDREAVEKLIKERPVIVHSKDENDKILIKQAIEIDRTDLKTKLNKLFGGKA